MTGASRFISPSFDELHDGDVGKEFGDRTNAIDGVGGCGRFALGIGHAEALGPYDLLVIDDSDRECGQFFSRPFVAG